MTDHQDSNAFKYIMEDLYKLYFGAKCTYREILESDDTYTRFKAVCRQCLVTEVDPDTTLESHLYYLNPEDKEAEVYRLLGARVKLSVPTVRKGFLGREEKVFKEEVWKIDDLLALSAHSKQFRGIVLSELQIPKRKLREFAL